jgi:hypothetical protein
VNPCFSCLLLLLNVFSFLKSCLLAFTFVCLRSLYVFQLLELNSTFVCPDGNGFKTSTMRLGADVIVFSRATSARYFMLFLLLCWFLPHALFPLNLFMGLYAENCI